MAFDGTPECGKIIIPGDVDAFPKSNERMQANDGAHGREETAQEDESYAAFLPCGHLCLPEAAKRQAVDGDVEGDVEGCAGVDHGVGVDAVAFVQAVPALPGVVDGRALECDDDDEDYACAGQDADQDEADDPEAGGVAAEGGPDAEVEE